MRLHNYPPPVTAGMYATGTPDEIAAATGRASERLQSDEHVDPLAAAYRELLERAGRRMSRALTAKATVLAAADEPEPDRRFVPPDGDEVIDTGAIADDVADVLADAHREAARVVVAELDYEGISYDVETVFTDELLARLGEVATTSIEAEMRDQYRFTLETAAEHGWSVASTADALGNKIADIAPHTARAMARTDLNGLANGGSLHVAQRSLATQEQPVYKTWLATPDERTRDTHVDANGQTVPINEHFRVGLSSMPYPGYPFAPPEEVINCRCTVTYTSDPAGATAVVTDPDAPTAKTDPLAFVTPSNDQLEAGQADYERWAEGELWGSHPEAKAESPEAYAAELEDKLSAELAPDRASVAIRSPADVALSIAEQKRFKSQFESKSSQGMFSPIVRATAERDLFSYPKELPATDRPIYGYMRGPTVEPGGGISAAVEMYGNVVWNLKNDVRGRTTFTASDSLGLNYVPSPINRPSHLSANPRQLARGFNIGTDLLDAPMSEWPVPYVEAQVHGGVGLDDVASVEVEYWSNPDVEAALDEFRDFAEQDAHRLREQLKASGYGHIEVKLTDTRLRPSARQASGEQALGLAHDGGGVNAGSDLFPVATGHDAQPVHRLTEGAVPLVEHADGGTVEPVTPALDEQHERVLTPLRDDGHATNDTSVVAGSHQAREVGLTPMLSLPTTALARALPTSELEALVAGDAPAVQLEVVTPAVSAEQRELVSMLAMRATDMQALASSLEALAVAVATPPPAPVVHVHVPELAAPAVHVQVPEQPAPVVHLAEGPAPSVQVDVHVPAAQPVVNVEVPDPPLREIEFERDGSGRIVRAEEVA